MLEMSRSTRRRAQLRTETLRADAAENQAREAEAARAQGEAVRAEAHGKLESQLKEEQRRRVALERRLAEEARKQEAFSHELVEERRLRATVEAQHEEASAQLRAEKLRAEAAEIQALEERRRAEAAHAEATPGKKTWAEARAKVEGPFAKEQPLCEGVEQRLAEEVRKREALALELQALKAEKALAKEVPCGEVARVNTGNACDTADTRRHHLRFQGCLFGRKAPS